jgi:hypothetical protein
MCLFEFSLRSLIFFTVNFEFLWYFITFITLYSVIKVLWTFGEVRLLVFHITFLITCIFTLWFVHLVGYLFHYHSEERKYTTIMRLPIQNITRGQVWYLMLVIPPIWEVEFEIVMVQGKSRQRVSKTSFQPIKLRVVVHMCHFNYK